MDFAKQLITEADNLPFSLECFRVAVASKKNPEESDLLTEEEVKELGAFIVDKIREQAKDAQPIYMRYSRDALYTLKVWQRFGSKEEINEYLRTTLESDPENAIELLKRFSSMTLGLPEERALFLDPENYEGVSKAIEPEVILTALEIVHGQAIDATEYPNDRTIPLKVRLARQFAFLHKEAQAAGQITTEQPPSEENTS
jgi:hypothetical protein